MLTSKWMVVVLAYSLAGFSAVETQSGQAAFDRIRQLEGRWQGTFQWSGARASSGEVSATYSVTGNDSAVIENLIMQGKTVMTSVYHVDGADLRMTHYCAAKNQPRLKATHIDESRGVVDFSFVDITNLDPTKPGHVEGLQLRFLDPDRITLEFTFGGDGKRSVEHIDLKRVK